MSSLQPHKSSDKPTLADTVVFFSLPGRDCSASRWSWRTRTWWRWRARAAARRRVSSSRSSRSCRRVPRTAPVPSSCRPPASWLSRRSSSRANSVRWPSPHPSTVFLFVCPICSRSRNKFLKDGLVWRGFAGFLKNLLPEDCRRLWGSSGFLLKFFACLSLLGLSIHVVCYLKRSLFLS